MNAKEAKEDLGREFFFKMDKFIELVIQSIKILNQKNRFKGLHICDSCHGRVSGINKICFLYSSYCRSQATAA